jgi:hypothetical protein
MEHGKGLKVYVNGNRYRGMWANGLPDGHGVFTWANGDEYEGGLRNGQKEGKGILKKDGAIYEGNFSKDKYQGEGRLRINNTLEYTGTFNEG